MILLYHAQLLFTKSAFTPQPTGLLDNLQHLSAVGFHLWPNPWVNMLSLPLWFGFQFLDVFVLISGFSLVLSLRGKLWETSSFLRHRLQRLLWPFWTVAWLSYPVLWLIGAVTHSYRPDAWHSFAGATFPLTSDYRGSLLLPTSGPWWFIPLVISFTLIFPLLWKLLQRWGALNLLLISTLLTVGYRALATYQLGGHPTYVILDTPAVEEPFQLFLAKLSTFVVGMVVAQAYSRDQGPLLWSQSRAMLLGMLLYAIGFICQFSRLGWIFADLLLPLGLSLVCMVGARSLARAHYTQLLMVKLGSHSYSYFLIHNLVVDRTLTLVVHGSGTLYSLLLPMMAVGTLVLAVLADYVRPLLKRLIINFLGHADCIFSKSSSLEG
jgi:peptidoglycan/LPS O-acetylase OafA/YrhL